MAVKPHGEVRNPQRGVYLLTWENITEADSGAPFNVQAFADKTVQVTGDFGNGGQITMQGTNEDTPVNWDTLHDAQGNDITIASGTPHVEVLLENVKWIRPLGSGSSGVDLDVQLHLKKT